MSQAGARTQGLRGATEGGGTAQGRGYGKKSTERGEITQNERGTREATTKQRKAARGAENRFFATLRMTGGGGLRMTGQKKRSGRCVLRIKSPHSTSEPLSVGRIKSVDVGAGLLANPRQAPEVAFSPSVVGGDVCEERLTALRLFFSSLRGIVRKAVSALAASVDFSAAFCRNKKRQKNTVGAQEGGKRRAG